MSLTSIQSKHTATNHIARNLGRHDQGSTSGLHPFIRVPSFSETIVISLSEELKQLSETSVFFFPRKIIIITIF